MIINALPKPNVGWMFSKGPVENFLECLRCADFAVDRVNDLKLQSHYIRIVIPRHCMLPLRFFLRHGDSDLSALLTDCVPPVDLQKVSMFRTICRKYEKEAGLSDCCWDWLCQWVTLFNLTVFSTLGLHSGLNAGGGWKGTWARRVTCLWNFDFTESDPQQTYNMGPAIYVFFASEMVWFLDAKNPNDNPRLAPETRNKRTTWDQQSTCFSRPKARFFSPL